MTYIISLSGGNNSLNCLKYCIDHYGKDNVVAIFADNNFEHSTLHDGLDWMERHFNIKIVKVKSDKYNDPFHINKQRSLIWHNAVRCSEEMKIIPIKNWIKTHFPNKEDFVLVLGYNTSEKTRMDKARKFQLKANEYNLFFPAECEDWIDIPYSYWRDKLGFPIQHVYEKGGRSNNCSGGCFKMSTQGWYILWKNDLNEFLKWEEYEQQIHDNICLKRDKKYGPSWRESFTTRECHLWMDHKRSLRDKRMEWENGIVPVFKKRSDGSLFK